MLIGPLHFGLLKSPPAYQTLLKRAEIAAHAEDGGTSSHVLMIGRSQIEVELHLAQSGLTSDDVLAWVRRSATAVADYYGQFPVRHARVIVSQSSDPSRFIHGATWGDLNGVEGLTRIRIGQSTSTSDLDSDWTMTHELVHMALTSLPDENHWLEEGLATYVEPIARSQEGQLSVTEVWKEMLNGMRQGEPAPGDRGLDQTQTWGRTYWGGALFSLVADVSIRRATADRKSLQDALRAIVAAGATINTERPLMEVLRIGDQATGTTVLEDLYASWRDKPVTVNLDQLWFELGVRLGPGGIAFDETAPLADIRRSMTQKISADDAPR